MAIIERKVPETACAGWEIYPSSLKESDELNLESDDYCNQLSDLAPILFIGDSGSTQVRIIDAQNLSYQLQYVERNGRPNGNPWSIRQTGIHHRHEIEKQSNFWLVLHPVIDSIAQKRLEYLFGPLQDTSEANCSPLKPHVVLFGSYIDNWRWYMRELGDSFEQMENVSLTLELEEDYSLSFTTLQSLRHLEGKIVALRAIFPSSLATIKALQDINQELQAAGSQSEEQAAGIDNAFHGFKSRVEGHSRSAKSLEKRVKRILQLLADALNLKNQATAADINSHLLKLTHETVDDSATIRAITLVTLIYLPSSFIATVLGMNLFAFDASTSKLKIARDFWIFIALALPLTACTLGYWFSLSHGQEKKRDQRIRKEMLKQRDMIKV